MGYLRYCCLLVLAFIPAPVHAHPVTYKGGALIDVMVGHNHSQVDATYSPTPSLGLTAGYMRFRDSSHQITEAWIPRVNALLKRWNLPEAQANIYLWGGAGATNREDAAAQVGTQLDWETRWLYSAAKFDGFIIEGSNDFHFATLRAGVAPYPVEFGQVNTFIILQSDYGSQSTRRWELAPVARFFFSDYLLEVGSTIDGDVMVNGMIHFYL